MRAHSLILKDEAATERLGADLAMALQPGDVLLLKGDLGAGKTTLARGLVRQLAGETEHEVPSPTYTLCQVYHFAFPVFHFDLYRIGDPDEIEELGLTEAIRSGVAMVEWPERASGHLPADALLVELEMTPEGGRQARISGGGEGAGALSNRVARSLDIREFLDSAWKEGCRRQFLQGDASTRRYETVTRDGETRVLMDCPRQPDGPPVKDGKPYSQIAHLAEDVVAFIAIDEALRLHGFAAPRIHGKSIRQGLLLCEYLGRRTLVDEDGTPIATRYLEAARLLAQLHRVDWPSRLRGTGGAGERYDHAIARYDEPALVMEASLLLDWYIPAYRAEALPESGRSRFLEIWHGLATLVEGSMPTLVLRDYHSPNLIWRDDEPFPRNLGLIDFQDAVIGPAAYDLASLGQDARVDIPAALEEAVLTAYMQKREEPNSNFDPETFLRDYAILAAQRATKILGIFVRLDRRDGKPGYLRHLPRLRRYLARTLGHPVLGDYRAWCEETGGILDGSIGP